MLILLIDCCVFFETVSIIKDILETQEFATLPTVAAKVLEVLNAESVNVRDVARIIENDVSLTVKLLRIANSSIYGTLTEVTSVQKAIITLGLSRLSNMVIGISIFSKFMMNSHRSVMPYIEKFWWHVACSSMVAKAFTLKTSTFYQENEFIGALLHDIGKLAMLQHDNEKYLQVIELIENQGMNDLEAEMQIYKCDHTQVGYAIAASWNLPQAIQDVIRYHHRPSEAEKNKALVATVRCTDLLCEVWDAGFYENITYLDLAETEAWKTLIEEVPDLADTDMAQFTFELETEFRRSEEFLNLISGDM